MGHKFSAVNGVKSENYTQPGNAINQIWAGDTEIISRLPFGDSDMEQAGWSEKGAPKIPWHNFIIPLKRGATSPVNSNPAFNFSSIAQLPPDQFFLCNRDGCFSNERITPAILTCRRNRDPLNLYIAAGLTFLAAVFLSAVASRETSRRLVYTSKAAYNPRQVHYLARETGALTVTYIIGQVVAWLGIFVWGHAYDVYQFEISDWEMVMVMGMGFLLGQVLVSTWAIFWLWCDLLRALRSPMRKMCEDFDLKGSNIEDAEEKTRD